MKKLLALVLALVMTLGLATVSSSAALDDFSDGNDVKYEEAMSVMNAVGVFVGDNGKLAPKDNLTRAQAAKIIAYLNLGSTAADALSKDVTAFSDVAVGNWAAGYITYCYNAGIIAGDGTGKFNPNDNVTALQFAKMLLVTLGYEAEREGLVGDDFALNTTKLAAKNGLYTDNENVSVNQPATREEAALYSFNALKANVVEYDSASTRIKGADGFEVTIGGSNAKPVAITTEANNYAGANTTDTGYGYQQLLEKLYGTKLTYESAALGDNVADDMNRPARKWTWTDGKTSTFTYAEDADYTEVISSNKEDRDTIAEYATKVMKKTFTWTLSKGVKINGGDTGVAGTPKDTELKIGDIVEFYVNANGTTVDSVSITRYSSAKLTADPATKVDGDDTTVRVPGVAGLSAYTDSDNVKGYAGLAKNDVVYYYVDNGGVYHLFKAEMVEGVLTARQASSLPYTYTISGKSYKANTSSGISATAVPAAGYMGDTYDYYLDNNGFIVYAKLVEAAESTDYAVILGIHYVKVSGASYTASNYVEAKLVKTDGTVETVKVDAVTIGSHTYEDDFDATTNATYYLYKSDDSTQPAAVSTDLVKKAVVSYSVNSDGNYELTKIASIGGSAVTFNGALESTTAIKTKAAVLNQASLTDYAVNDSTVFVVATKTGKETFKVYTGKNNAPTVTATEGVALVQSGYTKYVFVTQFTGSAVLDGEAIVLLPTADNTSVSYEDAVTERFGSSNVSYKTYYAVKDNAVELVKIKDGANAGNNVSTVGKYGPSYDSNGVITGLTSVSTTNLTSAHGWAYDGSTFVAGGTGYNCTSNVPVYFKSSASGSEWDVMTAADFNGEDDGNDLIFVKTNAAGDATDYVIIYELDDGIVSLKSVKIVSDDTSAEGQIDEATYPAGGKTLTADGDGNYAAKVEYNGKKYKVEVVTTDVNAKVKITGSDGITASEDVNTVTSGSKTVSGTGTTPPTATITVTAVDGTEASYTLTLTPAAHKS